jgi:hypothetical protein
MLDKAVPPVYCSDLWDYYWKIRVDGKFLCSEVLAFKQLTDIEIGEYELNEMFILDSFVNERLEYHRRSRQDGGK